VGLSTDYAGLAPADRRTRVRARAGRSQSLNGRPTRRRAYRRRASPLAQLVRGTALFGLITLSGLGVGGAALDAVYHERALPAVRFETLPLGGLSTAEVDGVLQTQLNAFRAAPVVFSHAGREWRPAAAEMGLRLDVEAMAHDAIRQGRTAPGPLRYLTPLATFATRPSVALRASLDQAQLGAFLGAVALEVDREPTDAGLVVRSGQLVVGPAAPGKRVDVPATAKLVQVPRSLEPQRVEVVVGSASPVLADEAVHEAQQAATRILAAPLTLRLGERTWQLTPATLGTMLEFRRVPGPQGEKLAAGLNEAKVAAHLRGLAAEIDRPAVEARLRWNGSGASVVREGADGIKLDQAAAVRAIMAQANQDAREIALSTSVVKPAVTSDAATLAGIKELVATGSSKFAGSAPERLNNIKVAASRLDGVVIPAGATFSFLKALGPITKENGYQEGLTIQGDATVPGIGGGVCQVSTTVFRAAFYAGLPIVERHQHTYRVSYYEQDGSPVGFDAAVYDPGVDLRFRNDTDQAMLMHAAFDAASFSLTFRLYSTPSGRDVKLAPTKANEVKAGPRLPDALDASLPRGTRKQVEWSADGVDATIRRTVSAGGQSLLTDAFFSRYVPWREKWAVGPA
jgi:vancomycin resistance protein YoaR